MSTISQVSFAKLQVPLTTPFKTALRTVDSIVDLVVIIELSDGTVGLGAAPSTPVITGDTHASVYAAIKDVLFPIIKGQNIEDIARLCQQVQKGLPHNSSAKAALEIALFDAHAKSQGKPLFSLLGGTQTQLKTDITISVDTTEKMLLDAEAALARGFDSLKLKVGREPEQDKLRILDIAQQVGDRASLILDVNQGWSAKQTVQIMSELESEGLALTLVEQPVHYADVDGLKYISRRIKTPVMADESAFTPQQVANLLAQDAAQVINIKLMKCGGISNAIKIAELAAAYDARCMMGCMLEGSISVAAAAHVASACAEHIPLIDLDGPVLGRYDPVKGGVEFNNARITLAAGNGLGIRTVDDLQEVAGWQF